MGEIMGGGRSMMTYIGAAQLKEAPKGAAFVRVTAQTNDVYGGWRGGARSTTIDAAVVIVAAALLIAGALASRRARPGALGFGGGALGPLPPLIAMTLSGFSTLLPLAFGGAALKGAAATTGAALIALVAAMPANLPGATEPRRAPWPATLATIAVAAGLPLLGLAAPSLLPPSGYALVFVVAAALSVLEALRPVTRD
jgi:hypothetical protein